MDTTQYNAVAHRIEELLRVVEDNTPKTDPNLIELDLLSSLMEAFEEQHFSIQ